MDELVDDGCVVCQHRVTPPGVRTGPCKHTYCAECLKNWIHACEAKSHTCPQCRTVLFPEPEYQYHQPEVVENYEQQLAGLTSQHRCLTVLEHSLKWFAKEIKLQKQFEVETGVRDFAQWYS